MGGGTEVYLGHDIIMLLQPLLCERDNASMNANEFTDVVHHGMDVWCDIVGVIDIDKVPSPLPCSLLILLNCWSC